MKVTLCVAFLAGALTLSGTCMAQRGGAGGEASTAAPGGGQGGVNAINDQSKTMGMPGGDEDFLKSALDYTNAEHALSVDAKAKASDPDVKAAAEAMETASADNFKRLSAYGPSLGLKPPKDLTGKFKKEQAKLGDSGDKYDKEWVKDMVNLHHDTISLYMTESTSSHEPQYQQLANKILPVEQKDATTLKTLQAKVGK